mgnify:CR=1 FL=1
MKIGFIGLGNMGAPMSRNLAKAGHDVFGFDLNPVSISGVTEAKKLSTASENMDVIITMLPDGNVLKQVYQDIIPLALESSIFIDCSTVDVESAIEASFMAKKRGIKSIDSPVSGGVVGAEAGTLTFMAGGDYESFNTVKPLFEIMGQKAVHCGDTGNGQAAKICNNMILGATMIVTCEAFSLADKLGLDRAKMFDVVSTSSGYSWSMNAYCPAPGIGPQSPSDNGYTPGFSADLMLKDLRLSQQAAEDVNADTPIGYHAKKLYETFVEDEDGTGKDFSAMLPRFSNKSRG